MKKVLVILTLIMSASTAFAQFDLPDLNARGLAMSGAYASLAYDANAVSENPGALPFIPKAGITIMGSPMLLGLSDGNTVVNFVGNVALPLGFAGAPGVSFNYLNTSVDTGTVWHSLQTTISYGYGIPIPMIDLGIGVGARIQYWQVPKEASDSLTADLSSTTFNLNVGIYAKIIPQLSIGVVGKDLLSLDNSVDKDDTAATSSIPRTVVVAAAYHFKDVLTVALDADMVLQDGLQLNINTGVEGVILKTVSLRGGVAFNDLTALGITDGNGENLLSFLDVMTISAGVGYQVRGFSVDLSYKYTMSYGTGGNIAASVGYAFDAKRLKVKGPETLLKARKLREAREKAKIDLKDKERNLKAEARKKESDAKSLLKEAKRSEDDEERLAKEEEANRLLEEAQALKEQAENLEVEEISESDLVFEEEEEESTFAADEEGAGGESKAEEEVPAFSDDFSFDEGW